VGADGVEGVDGVAGVLFFFLGFGGFFRAGSEPDGLNATICAGASTWTGLTADGAAAVLEPPPACAIPKAAPNATRAATTPIAASLPGVISTSCEASRNRGSCS
jgi:hypothetical protein